MADKRNFARHEINVPVRIKLLSPEAGEGKLYAAAYNVSAGGVLFKSDEPLLEGSQVEIEIFLQFEELIKPSDPEGTLIIAATGHVLRSGPEGTAIRFNEDYEFRKRWDLIKKKNPDTVTEYRGKKVLRHKRRR